MIDDPWKNLSPPDAADAINARRVDADVPWGFFWARGLDRRCLLVLKHSLNSTPHGRLPKLKGIEIVVSDRSKGDGHMLVFTLLDSSHRDIFHRLCRDIVTSASVATSEREAVDVALARTWRWHHLLRGGGDGLLSSEQQKGLIGELLAMERHLFPCLSTVDAVAAWCGPLGAPKDFEIGRICIEVKARRGAATPYVAINSEHQLDDTGVDALFLQVVELDRAPADTREGFTLTDVAERVRDTIASADNVALNAFEPLLSATGFRWEDDYSVSLWMEGPSRLFRVSDGFPRITARTVAAAVTNVKYSISLPECEAFLVEGDALGMALKERKNAD